MQKDILANRLAPQVFTLIPFYKFPARETQKYFGEIGIKRALLACGVLP